MVECEAVKNANDNELTCQLPYYRGLNLLVYVVSTNKNLSVTPNQNYEIIGFPKKMISYKSKIKIKT